LIKPEVDGVEIEEDMTLKERKSIVMRPTGLYTLVPSVASGGLVIVIRVMNLFLKKKVSSVGFNMWKVESGN